MNELTTIRDLGEALDQELRGPSPQLRHRVITDLSARPRRAWRGPHRPGPGWRLVMAAGLAVVVTAALLSAATVRLWGSAPAASAQAAVILRQAAVTAAHQPALRARPSQFVYTESVESAATLAGAGSHFSAHIHTVLREIWLSADGTRNGILREQPRSASDPGLPAGPWRTTVLPGCRHGQAGGTGSVLPGGTPSAYRCVPQPAYLSRLPTSASAMRAYLYGHRYGQNPPDVQAFITAGDLIRESYVPPAALAALFAAVAQIPGVSVAEHAVNAAGQPGVAVQQTYRGISEQLIFNRRTHTFIGERQVVVGAGVGLRVGTVLDSTAVLQQAVVRLAGLLPCCFVHIP